MRSTIRRRRSRESQRDKYLPTGLQHHSDLGSFLIERGCLTSSKIIHNFAKVVWVSSSYEDTQEYDTHSTVDGDGGIECEHAKNYGNEGADPCQ
jgi:hypothetical protein